MNNKDYTLPAYLDTPQNHNPNFILWLIKDVYHQITIVGKMNKEKALEFAFDQFKCSDKIKELYKKTYEKH